MCHADAVASLNERDSQRSSRPQNVEQERNQLHAITNSPSMAGVIRCFVGSAFHKPHQ
jgi:hypothetical protein